MISNNLACSSQGHQLEADIPERYIHSAAVVANICRLGALVGTQTYCPHPIQNHGVVSQRKDQDLACNRYRECSWVDLAAAVTCMRSYEANAAIARLFPVLPGLHAICIASIHQFQITPDNCIEHDINSWSSTLILNRQLFTYTTAMSRCLRFSGQF